MKTTFFIVILIALFGYACEKDSFCYVCTTTFYTTVSKPLPGYPQTQKTVVEKCDWSERDRNKYIKESTQTVTSNIGGVTVTVKSTCNCVKK
jgi:hypothetical protein